MQTIDALNKTRTASGFSLVELMVVVAVIGVLAALASTKFSIFMTKAKRAEAVNNVGVIDALYKAFEADADRSLNWAEEPHDGGSHLYFNSDSDGTAAGKWLDCNIANPLGLGIGR